MKRIKMLMTLPIILCGCNNLIKTETFLVKNYTYSFITSEVQEVTHDVYLAHCDNGYYIEVPENTKKVKIDVIKKDKVIYYHVNDTDEKVNNGGYYYHG